MRQATNIEVGLLTYHFSDNYGALYQAYALRRWFLDQDIKARFLNYHPRHVEEGGNFERPLDPRNWRRNVTIAYMKLMHLRGRVFGDRIQRAAFDEFIRSQLGVEGPRRLHASELVQDVDGLNLLVCGSDQVWNPSVQLGLDPVYFLSFPGAERCRRVSYAPSFGRSELASAYHEQVRALVGQLDQVSVRERSGVDIVRGVTGREVIVVPDPTILLGRFDTILGPITPDDSVFCYALRTDETIREVAEQARAVAGGALYSPRTSRQRWRDIGTGVRPGPLEWLRMLARARNVVSNSFHGITLSVILNRPFVAVALPGTRTTLNTRTINLLESVGLMERFVDSTDPVRVREVLSQEIDWTCVNARLAEQRAVGANFLREALNVSAAAE